METQQDATVPEWEPYTDEQRARDLKAERLKIQRRVDSARLDRNRIPFDDFVRLFEGKADQQDIEFLKDYARSIDEHDKRHSELQDKYLRAKQVALIFGVWLAVVTYGLAFDVKFFRDLFWWIGAAGVSAPFFAFPIAIYVAYSLKRQSIATLSKSLDRQNHYFKPRGLHYNSGVWFQTDKTISVE